MPAPGRNRLLLFQSGAIAYLLRATFGTDIAAPLPASLSVDVGGPLTVVDTNNRMSQSGGVFVINGATAAANGILSAAFARVIGRAFAFSLPTRTTIGNGALFSFSDTDLSSFSSDLYFDYNAGLTLMRLRAGAAIVDTAITIGSGINEYFFVMRSTGMFLFARAGGTGAYTLIWVSATVSAAMYAKVYVASSTTNFTLDNLRVLDLATYDSRFATDYGLALNRSTFTAANGTALTAIVPEVGGAWTNAIGTWNVQGNKAQPATMVSTAAMAFIDAGNADVVIEATVRFSAVNYGGIVVRYVDTNNYWIVNVRVDNTIQLFEVNAGVSTSRASSAVTIATNTDYRLVVVTEGSTITAYVNNGNKITYASASLNQTSTKHGIWAADPSSIVTRGTIDEFAIYPRTLVLRGDI